MPNPYPAIFETKDGILVRLSGDIDFTDPSNQPGGGGGGQVNSVTAGDASITIGGTVTDPTVEVSSLGITTGKIAAASVTQAKIAAAAVAASQMDSGAASANWVPLADGSGGVVWAASPGVNSLTAADTSVVVGGTASAPTVRTGTLDTVATQHPPTAAVAMNAQKITGLANGTVATDAAAFGQIPTALPPNGSAGGDLSGSYPNPTVAAVEGVAVSATAPTANQVLTASDATHAAWATPSTGFANPMTTKGDIIIENATPAPARLGIGTSGQVLTVSAGLPSWQTPTGGSGAVTQLARFVAATAVANFDFTSVSGAYNQLWLDLYLRSDASATFDTMLIRFNGDTAANYNYGSAVGGSSSSTIGANGATGIGQHCSAATSDASYFTPVRVTIPQYAATVGFKGVTLTSFHRRSSTSYFGESGGGEWASTAAITEITIVSSAGANWVTGSSATLYGVL